MVRTHFETSEFGIRNSDFGMKVRSTAPQPFRNPQSAFRIRNIPHSAIHNPQSAFTLTELLVVITIIAILASLITGAVIGGLNRAKEAAITIEMQQIGAAADNFKNNLGIYPPNSVTSNGASSNSQEMNSVRADVRRVLKKAFPRINASELALVDRLIGDTSVGGTNAFLQEGMSGSEALVFWLGGFSKDAAFPISGPGGPSYGETNGVNGLTPEDERLEDRNWGDGFEFDLGRLGPRDANGQFNGRTIEYSDVSGNLRRINFWTYTPSGSQEPIVYFDTSNVEPIDRVNNYGNYDLQSKTKPHLATSDIVAPIRQRRETVASTVTAPNIDQTKYVEQGRFQILHCGTDDIWGDFSVLAGANPLLAPEGPFIGDIADTLGNFMEGTLEDKQE